LKNTKRRGHHEFLKKDRLLVDGRRYDLDHLPTYDRLDEKNRRMDSLAKKDCSSGFPAAAGM